MGTSLFFFTINALFQHFLWRGWCFLFPMQLEPSFWSKLSPLPSFETRSTLTQAPFLYLLAYFLERNTAFSVWPNPSSFLFKEGNTHCKLISSLKVKTPHSTLHLKAPLLLKSLPSHCTQEIEAASLPAELILIRLALQSRALFLLPSLCFYPLFGWKLRVKI